MESLKELLMPKSFNRFSYMAVLLWIVCGVILLGSFAEMEKSDFHCTVKLEKKSLVQGKCSEQYKKRFDNLGIPVYAFVIINFALILTVCAIYSQFIKPTVDRSLEAISNEDAEGQRPPETPPRRLFRAYCCQLIVRFGFGILFTVLVTQLLPNFPSSYDCDLTQESNRAANVSSMSNIQNRTIYECRNEGAAKKTFWTKALTVVNAVFALIILIEFIWILLRVKKVGKKFLEDSRFLADHINSNHRYVDPFAFIEKLKIDIIKTVTNLEALTFDKPGEGERRKDLNLEQIYVKLVAQEDRQKHDFAEDREQQLKVYPEPSKNAKIFEGPEDIIDSENKKILIVGRPGIGKTLFCTKFLLDWASGRVFNKTPDTEIQYDVAFLIKFRKFNSVENLSLRELLTRSLRAENYLQSQTLPNEVWRYIRRNLDKVLILLDGFDEYKARKDIQGINIETENNSERIPLPVLFFKIMTGNLLPGATVVTTTRPTAVSSISTSIKFDKTIEILGFTEEKVEQYVKNFTENENSEGAGERILEHIKNNMNLFSLCYIPVNCFIICSCLVHLVKSSGELPAKVTDIYNFAMKLFFFRHNEQYKENPPSHEDIMSGTFPPEVEEQFKQLGEIAFNGLEKGTLIFGKSEVQGFENSALFHQMPDDKRNPFKHEAQFCFLHLTMQEFLAARHIVDTMNKAQLRRFVYGYIMKGEWHVVLQFVAGLLGEGKRPMEIFTNLLPVETVKRGDGFTYWPTYSDKHLALTIMKCLFECENKESHSVVKSKLEEIGFNTVDFSRCGLAPSDCTAVVYALKNVPQISRIYLYDNPIGSLGCVEIRKLLDNGNCQLTKLDLSINNIDDNGVLELCKVISNSKLTKLVLRSNKITDVGVLELCKVITNSKLTELDLSWNKITDVGVLELCKVITSSKLTELHLSHNKITDVSVNNLRDVLTNPNCKLTWLGLRSNKAITAKAKQQITNANPNCKVRTDLN